MTPFVTNKLVLPSGLLIWISNSLILARLCGYAMDHAVPPSGTTIPTIILVTLAVKCAFLVKIVADANTKHIATLIAANRGWDIVAPAATLLRLRKRPTLVIAFWQQADLFPM